MSKQNPKVVFVYPPNQLMAVEIPRPDGSLGLLYLAGALRRIGIETEILDASVGVAGDSLRETFFSRVPQPNSLMRIGMTPERLEEFFGQGQFDIVGINSNFTPQTRMALEVAMIARKVKKNTFVITGGVNARAIPERFLNKGLVDMIVTTEAERIIIEIVRQWQKGGDFNDLNGVIYHRDGHIETHPAKAKSIYTNLDQLPFPAWDMLPFAKYDEINSPHGSITPGQKRRYAPLMTSRGCPFRCAYCHISREKEPDAITGDIGGLRLKSIDRVMEEVRVLRSLGVSHLYLEDDSLLAKKTRVKDLFSRLSGLGMKISDVNGVNLVHFGINSGNGHLKPDREYLEVMKDAGFDEIVFPVESGNQRILDKYATGKLNLSRLDVLELVRTAVEVGITCPVNMMMGFPDETEEEMQQSIELARKLVDNGAPYVTFFIPIPFPGSTLYETAVRNGHLAPDFDPDTMNWKNAIMTKTTVPPERIIELRDQAWETVNTDDYKNKRKQREIGDSRFAK